MPIGISEKEYKKISKNFIKKWNIKRVQLTSPFGRRL
jgi:hypothetical protein